MNNVIVGTSIASLVATYELIKKGHNVTLISNGGKWGGHFAGIDACGTHFDAGMTIIELSSSELKSRPLSEYDPNKRNNVGNYLSLIEVYLKELLPLRVIDSPSSYFRGQWAKDFILSNNLDILDLLTLEEKKIALNELEKCSQLNWRHAINKITNQDLHTTASYYETSIYNHGTIIHNNFIEPFIRKLTNVSSQEVNSIYHRRLWAPLYYPETLCQYIKKEIDAFTKIKIHYPENSSLLGVVNVFLERIKKSQKCTIIERKISHINHSKQTITLADNNLINYDTIVWGGRLSNAFKAFKISPIEDYSTTRINLTFAFILLDKKQLIKNFSILFNLDENNPCYRVTNLSNCSGENKDHVRLILEFNTDYLSKFNVSKKPPILFISNILINQGIISDKRAILKLDIKGNLKLLPISNQQYDIITNHNRNLLTSSFSSLTLMGDSSTVTTRSFADNIVQGLQYAEAF